MKSLPRSRRATGHKPTPRYGLAIAVLLAGLSAATPQAAFALDSGPSISVGDTAPGAGATVLSNVKITYPGAQGLTLGIGKLTLKGLKQSADGFSVDEAVVENLAISAVGDKDDALEIPLVTLRGIAGSPVSSASLVAEGATGNLPPLASLLLSLKADSIEAPQAVFHSNGPAGTTATYSGLAVTGLAAGKIASAGFDKLEAHDKTTTTSLGKAGITGLDMNAYAAWFDDSLAAKASPGQKPVYSAFEFNDIGFTDATSRGTLKKIAGTDFKLAPPAIKPSELAGLLTKMGAESDYADKHPAEMVKLARTFLPAFSLGSLEFDSFTIKDDKEPPITFGLMRIEAISGSRIGEIRLGDVSGATKDDNAPFTLGSVSLRGISVADLDPLLDMLGAGGSVQDIRVAQYPKVRADSFAMTDFSADMPADGPVHIDGFTVDTPAWTGFLPSTLAIHLKGLRGPVDSVKDPQSRQTFDKLGIKTIEVNADINLAWKEADQTLALGPTSVEIGQFAKGAIDGTIGNVQKAVFLDPVNSYLALFGADFRGASLGAEDRGGLVKIIAASAQDNNITTEQMAEGSAMLAKSNLTDLLGADSAGKIGDAIKAFILKPDSLKIDIQTSKPLPLAPFVTGQATDPATLEEIKNSITVNAKAN